MKTTLEKVRNMIAASMAGWLPEEYEQQQREEKLKSAVNRFLENHPEYIERYTSKPMTAPAVASVRDSKEKTAKIKKALGAGAGGFQAHEIDPEMLRLAREKCRQAVAENPERYSHIIETAPLRA